jgi:hypothetical protein
MAIFLSTADYPPLRGGLDHPGDQGIGMWLKAPVRRQQSGIRVGEPNGYLTGKGKSS